VVRQNTEEPVEVVLGQPELIIRGDVLYMEVQAEVQEEVRIILPQFLMQNLVVVQGFIQVLQVGHLVQVGFLRHRGFREQVGLGMVVVMVVEVVVEPQL
jgi:hypothetical protein